MSALIFILVVALLGILGYLITPDSTPYANNQHLELATKKPGFSVVTAQYQLNREIESPGFFTKMLFGAPLKFDEIPIHSYRLTNDSIWLEKYTGMKPNNGPWIAYHKLDFVFALQSALLIRKHNQVFHAFDIDGNPIEISKEALDQKVLKQLVKKHFWFGTDLFGRDYLSQLIIGTRVSLSVGFIAVLISLLVGVTLGAIAAYFGKWIDELIVWFINVVWSIPTLLLVIALTMVLGKGFWQIFIAVGLTMWVEVARVVRGQVLSIRQKEFVEAGVALGYTNARIIFRHILPNVVSPLIVISAANFASAILIEAGLSFLGIGVQPPTPSWGIMIKEHYGYIVLDYAYLAVLPGVAIMLVVLAFMIIGNGLRDALDVKSLKN